MEKTKVVRIAQAVKMFAGAFISALFAFMSYTALNTGTNVSVSGRRAGRLAKLINEVGDVLEPVGGLATVTVILVGISLFFIYLGYKELTESETI